jgi:hypothetical protein
MQYKRFRVNRPLVKGMQRTSTTDKKPLGIAIARPGHELGARKPHDRSYTLMA